MAPPPSMAPPPTSAQPPMAPPSRAPPALPPRQSPSPGVASTASEDDADATDLAPPPTRWAPGAPPPLASSNDASADAGAGADGSQDSKELASSSSFIRPAPSYPPASTGGSLLPPYLPSAATTNAGAPAAADAAPAAASPATARTTAPASAPVAAVARKASQVKAAALQTGGLLARSLDNSYQAFLASSLEGQGLQWQAWEAPTEEDMAQARLATGDALAAEVRQASEKERKID